MAPPLALCYIVLVNRHHVSVFCLATLASSKPIMVTFGTNEGPIIPREPKAEATIQQRTIATNPAPVSRKHNLQKKDFSRDLNLGVDYTGPHIFEKQDYEISNAKKDLLRQALKYNKPHYYRQIEKHNNVQTEAPHNANNPEEKYVPQIGIIYLSGVRYYVPQIVYYPKQESEENSVAENSVYDSQDVKTTH
ncbi:hypothetical protein NQ317_012940 [Molorchus minor]|uniref:Uncharacterized protein n=1 Tax=Molorchus minor TaxID=1323400 RepID=A0ABQ9JP53_9CUCU|nr:hypothetical protein NQ317_012940 [Molorchus minor]